MSFRPLFLVNDEPVTGDAINRIQRQIFELFENTLIVKKVDRLPEIRIGEVIFLTTDQNFYKVKDGQWEIV